MPPWSTQRGLNAGAQQGPDRIEDRMILKEFSNENAEETFECPAGLFKRNLHAMMRRTTSPQDETVRAPAPLETATALCVAKLS